MSDHDINAEHHDDHDDHNHSATYWKVFFGLMICTAISTVVGIMISNGVFDGNELSGWGIMITVSCVKAFLVITFFMHLKWDDKFNVFVFTSALLFMSIFFIVTALDLGFRGAVNPETDTFVLRDEQAAIAAEEARKNAAAAEAAAAETAGTSAKLVVPGQPE